MRIQHVGRPAFTLIELLTVIVVIGILAALVTVSYHGITERAADVELKTELSNAASSLALYLRTEDMYPATGNLSAAGVEDTDVVTFEYASEDVDSYCLTGTSERAQKSYYMTSSSNAFQEGACPDHVGYTAPVPTHIVAAEPGVYWSIAVDSDGVVYGWGDNDNGRIGDGTTDDSPVPVPVAVAGTPMEGVDIVDIATGLGHTLALDVDGNVYSWGLNSYGQLGDDSTTESTVPVAVVTASTPMSGKEIVDIAAGNNFSVALASDGTVYSWGDNGYGQLGNSSTTPSHVPVAVTTSGTAMDGKIIVAISGNGNNNSVAALDSDGAVYTWGMGSYGRLGNGGVANSYVPVAVTTAGTAMSGKEIVAIATGAYHHLALDTDGAVYSWGRNGDRQLGSGTAAYETVPVAVTTSGTAMDGKEIVSIAAGNYYSIVAASDGTVYAWGDNTYGQFGGGVTTSVDSAVPVASSMTGAPVDGAAIVAVSAGAYHTVVIDVNGEMYAWGRNTYGALGDNTTTNSPSPVLVLW